MTGIVFRRLLFGAATGGGGGGASRLAAAFARALGLEFAALYIEDEDVLGLAGYAFVRETRLFAGARRVEAGEMERDIARAAALLRQRLQAAAREAGLGLSFEVRRGRVAETLARQARASDIVAVPIPIGLASRLGRGGSDFVAGAFACRGSVLFLPEAPAVRAPGIVAWLGGVADAAVLDFALRIARAGDVPLGVLRTPAAALSAAAIQAAIHGGGEGLDVTVIEAEEAPGPAKLGTAFLVLARTATGPGSREGLELTLAGRTAPLLLIEPTTEDMA
jgi:hypothetical protein